ELGARAGGTAVVAGGPGAALPLGTPAAIRLARALGGRACGRICLLPDRERLLADAGELAPLVLDVPHGSPPALAASAADLTVLVASPEVEQALAAVVAASLARSG